MAMTSEDAVRGPTTSTPAPRGTRHGASPPRLQVHRVVGALVVTAEGVFDVDLLRAVDRYVTTVGGSVILDLTSCALTDSHALEQLGGRRWEQDAVPVLVVCPRRTARRLLARAGVADRLRLFRSIEEALSSDEDQEGGDGSGTGSGQEVLAKVPTWIGTSRSPQSSERTVDEHPPG